MMFLGITGQDQSQGSVTGDVAGCSEAVLQGKDSEHQGSAGVIKEQDAGNES